MEKFYHPYHLVNPSPWPFCLGMFILYLTMNLVLWFHLGMSYPFVFSLMGVLFFMFIWFKDMYVESNIEGYHSNSVLKGLKIGFMLFMMSEVLFFFSFFWAFFHSSLSPSMELGLVWPPFGISALDPFSMPLLNTMVLLSSGATVTWAHHSLINKDHKNLVIGLMVTIILGLMFTLLQLLEYMESSFNMSDSVYGSVFFVATGFHGLHVMMGTVFLSVCLFKSVNFHFTDSSHFTFESASWYWHFVDVVWLFLYVFMYWWGS